ncbi:MAG: hypothetical protein IJH13_02020 [Bacilli bacterium]|nr:hypothetical protein [Bacilli bacterium]
MEKKSKIIIIILSVIIALLVLGIIGYIIYDNPFASPKVEEKKKVKKEKKENPNALKGEEKEEIKKHTEEYLSLAKSFPITDVDDVDDQAIFWFLTMKLQNYSEGFAKEEMERLMEKYFKDDINIVYGDINCNVGDGVLYKLDSNSSKYIRVGDHGHGGAGLVAGEMFFEDITKDGDYITVKTQILYSRCDDADTVGPISVYFTKCPDESGNSVVYRTKAEGVEITEEEFKTIKDKVPYTIFKFKISEDKKNYGLVSVEIKDA